MKDIKNYNLLNHNTFGISGNCRRFVEFDNVDELQACVRSITAEDKPLLIIGGGSNLLLTRDFPGLVLHSVIMGREVVKESDGKVWLRCGSGETWDDIVAYAVEKGWHGAENLSLIPGEVGASAVQNIGAYGAEAKDLIAKVEAVEIATGNVVEFSNEDCRYAYRQSRFKNEWKDHYVITYVTYCFSLDFCPDLDYGNIRHALEEQGISKPTAQQLRQTIINIREAKLPDPKVTGNAGSFFMNPVVGREVYERLAAQYEGMPHYVVDADHIKIPAGWMIEQCGWKGASLGRAGVHDRQALVLVNRGGATGEEVVTLYKRIIEDVRAKFGIEIHPEVNVI